MNIKRQEKAGNFGNHLVVMAKYPELGRVKTRLGQDIGSVEATRFYRHNLQAVLRRFQNEKRWQTHVALAPDSRRKLFQDMVEGRVQVQKQGFGNLGKRMQSVFSRMPAGRVIIIGSDIPNIHQDVIANAFHQLGSSDMVLGAGEDGGYWLIGMKRTPAILSNIFDNVAWSTGQTFRQTLDNLSDYSVTLLEPLNDIDDGADYADWQNQGAHY